MISDPASLTSKKPSGELNLKYHDRPPTARERPLPCRACTTPQLCTEGSDGFCCFNAGSRGQGSKRRAQRRDCRAILFVAGLSASLVALSLRFISYSLSAVLISLSAVLVRHRSTFPKRSPRDYRHRPRRALPPTSPATT